MKKWIPLILVACFAAWAVGDMRAPKQKEYDLAGFGRLPVLLNGRIQPFDSVARNTLLSISGKSEVRVKEEQKLTGFRRIVPGMFCKHASKDTWWVTTNKLSATEWLIEAMTRPEEAATRKIFRTQHPDLESMLGTLGAQLEYYSFNDLTNHFDEIDEQARKIMQSEQGGGEDAAKLRTPFQKDLMHLYQSLVMYHRLQNTLQPDGSSDFAHELNIYKERIPAGLAALQASEKKEKFDEIDLQTLSAFFKRYDSISRVAYALVVPPLGDQSRDAWSNIGSTLKETMRSQEIQPGLTHLAAISTAYTKQQPKEFNQAVADYRVWLQMNNLLPELKKGQQEFSFNQWDLFTKAMYIYVTALLIAFAYWVTLSPALRKSAFYLVVLAFAIHTFGLGFRMYLEGRPPVTNLYSSAIFVGWMATLVGIILERIFKGAIGVVVSCLVGFSTLIIAYHLAQGGDTMEMLRAVLDTNLWLSTHVVCITIGYSAMFLAGFLAIIYILLGFFTPRLRDTVDKTADSDLVSVVAQGRGKYGRAAAGVVALEQANIAMGKETMAKVLSRMVYGIVCFATLFSFVGTILGGIWADQSWGRFWGWDPKENGALLIVLWCAIWLHARWGGLAKERGLMAMAIFGNIVTSFSWFGVNMLGVGLHSYGFMEEAFYWLIAFMLSQVALIVLCLLPKEMWRSFKGAGESKPEGRSPVVPSPSQG